jgi:hypothetical protein
MLLILSNSVDGTTDAIVQELGPDLVFRFNVDQWAAYSVSVGAESFTLEDPSGRKVTEEDIRSVYVRKPNFPEDSIYTVGGNLEHYSREQVLYLLNEVYNLFAHRGMVSLVEKRAESRFGKVMQMRLAEKFFDVPPWEIYWGKRKVEEPDDCHQWVVKSLKATFTADHKFLYTRPVDRQSLDSRYPWFTQQRVESTHDVTIAFVAGQCFAYELCRASFDGDDWRYDINRRELPWEAITLESDMEERVRHFMRAADLRFGRLDFLRSPRGWHFLEVNANGQWLWLDLDQQDGLFAAVIDHLRNDLSRHDSAGSMCLATRVDNTGEA